MKSARWFLLVIAMLTVALFLTACSDSGTGPSVPGASPSPGSSTPVVASSPVVTNAKPQYPGSVDKKDCDSVGGWVISGKDSTIPVKVEFYIDGKLIDSATATTLRPDLTSWGTGRHGFTFKIPAAYKDGNPHASKIKVAGTDQEVPFIQNASGIQCPAS